MGFLRVLIFKAYFFLWKFILYCFLSFKSYRERQRNGSYNNLVSKVDFLGGAVIIMALYQKGKIRRDVKEFLRAAKTQGIYVIGINTRKISWNEEYKNLFDVYIEKDNFGRDFGSYKSGFEYVYGSAIDHKCSRLMMINDSVFFSKKHCHSFIENMFKSEVQVLGATENHDIEHHLGSFCITMDGDIVRAPILKKYWKDYKKSDIRLETIVRGEMELSKTLKKLVSSDDQFRAFYDTSYVANYIDMNPEVVTLLGRLSRKSDLVPWEKFTWKGAVSKSPYLRNVLVIEDSDPKEIDVNDWGGLEGVVPPGEDRERFVNEFTESVQSHFLACFNTGSQLHINNVFLHYIGLPIVKLDGLYRGVFDSQDIENIAKNLDESQKDEFRRIMYSRPYGARVLFGWKNMAFRLGFI